MKRWMAAALMTLGLAPALAQPQYHTNKQLAAAMKEAASADKQLFELTTLAEGPGGEPIQVFRAGAEDPARPALLVVAGLDGRHLIGTEMALAYVQSLAADTEAAEKRYTDRTVYVIPRVNFEGADAYFAKPLAEQGGISAKRDADKDGLTGEDMADDLNGDGVITWVRVKDAKGTMVADGDDKAFLREAKRTEGERGEWLLLSEGRDDDGDEQWNEEQDAGVNLARNFVHGFEWYARDSGPHQLSEPVTRALADFVIAHRNIAAVVVFGFEDNLLSPPPSDKATELKFPGSGGHSEDSDDFEDFNRKPVSAMDGGDLGYLAEFAKKYREDMNLPDAVRTDGKDSAARGGLGAFAYFTRGRMTMTTPAWAPAVQLEWNKKDKKDEEKKEEKKGKDDKKAEVDPEVKKQQEFRDWLVKENPDAWKPWEKIDHPDFAGQEAEIGGFAPFAKINPPASMVADIASTHTMMLNRAADALPRVKLRHVEAKDLDGGVAEVTVIVENTGGMPDVANMGRYMRYVRATRVEFDAGKGGEVLGGGPIVKLDPLAANGGFQEVRRIVRLPQGGNEVTVRVVSDCAGSDASTVTVGK